MPLLLLAPTRLTLDPHNCVYFGEMSGAQTHSQNVSNFVTLNSCVRQTSLVVLNVPTLSSIPSSSNSKDLLKPRSRNPPELSRKSSKSTVAPASNLPEAKKKRKIYGLIGRMHSILDWHFWKGLGDGVRMYGQYSSRGY